MLKETNQKIRQLDLEQKEEFTKIAQTFKQLREMIFEREKEVKDVLFSQIKEAQKCLRADVSVAQNILGELLNLKSRTVALKQTFDRDLD